VTAQRFVRSVDATSGPPDGSTPHRPVLAYSVIPKRKGKPDIPQIVDTGAPVDPGAAVDPGDPAKLRKGYRALILAGVLEMAMGGLYMAFPLTGRGSFHIFGGIWIIAAGLVVIGFGLRVRGKVRAANRVG
jgi:hypothetical protein